MCYRSDGIRQANKRGDPQGINITSRGLSRVRRLRGACLTESDLSESNRREVGFEGSLSEQRLSEECRFHHFQSAGRLGREFGPDRPEYGVGGGRKGMVRILLIRT